MKKLLSLLTIMSFLSAGVNAQAPQGINYQSVARDGTGQILSNHLVSIEFAIHDSIPTGPIIYSETQIATTNTFGIFSTVIGAGGVIIGNFSGINWGLHHKYLEVLMDFNGGTNYLSMGTSEFESVPYALYSNSAAGSVTGLSYDTSGVLNITTPTGTYTGKGVWTTTGNGGLSITNYIGTTDNIDFILKGHGVEALRVTAGGALLAAGNNSNGITPASGAGTRMMWIPAKAAFRAGSVTGTAWDDANIGNNSIALGTDVLASGTGATAIGASNTVTGNGGSAYGNNLIVKTLNETVIGSYNDTTGSGSSTTWNASDPAFQIGSGTSTASRGNAMTVTKGGTITANGLTVKQGMTLTPATPITVSGTDTIHVGTQGFIILYATTGSTANYVILTNGQSVGQILVIEVTTGNGSGHGITFENSQSYNMKLSSTVSLGNQDTITLLWDGTSWVQLSVSGN